MIPRKRLFKTNGVKLFKTMFELTDKKTLKTIPPCLRIYYDG